MYQTIRNMKVRDERGFTLVELLIVIAIIAILAAIAIPQFAAHRARAVEASMMADVRNAAITVEAIFVDAGTYAGLSVADGGPGPATATLSVPTPAVSATVRLSAGNTLTVVAATATTYDICIAGTGARAGRETVTINEIGAMNWAAACAVVP